MNPELPLSMHLNDASLRQQQWLTNATSVIMQNFSYNMQEELEDSHSGTLPGFNITSPASTRSCVPWEGAKHLVFQSANVCYIAAFLVPHRYQFTLLIRTLLSVGFLLSSLWAGAIICAPDILAWNLLLFMINLSYAGYIAYKQFPPRIDPELQDLYLKVFMPLKVKKKHFKELVQDADMVHLEHGEYYAMEGVTASDERLSILLTGKMKATCEHVILHYILPLEFVDSPEWESCEKDSDKLFQVTITAIERCKLITWRRKNLEELLSDNKFLDVVIYNLIGKDITHKLYSLNEYHGSDEAKLIAAVLPDWWRYQVPKSLSVDAVHTGTKGKVRSQTWRDYENKKERERSESVGSSPVCNSRHSAHYSDPGPYDSTKSDRATEPFQEPHVPEGNLKKEEEEFVSIDEM